MGEFRKILSRNLILVMLPLAVALAAVFFTFFQMSHQSDYLVYDYKDGSDPEVYYVSGYRNVAADMSGLKFSGFEVKDRDIVSGKYYYRYKDGKLEFFLLSNKTASMVDKGQEIQGKKRFTIIKDESDIEYMIGNYIESYDLQKKSFEGIGSPYIFSEIDFPYAKLLVVRIAYRVLLVLVVLMVLYMILALLFPRLNFETRGLGRFGKVKDVIKDIDEELEERLLYKWDNIYITDNYYLALYTSRIDVIKLDEIRYMTKHREERKRFPFRKEVVYTLTASNTSKMYYEIDFPNEDVIDRVVSHIRGDENESDNKK